MITVVNKRHYKGEGVYIGRPSLLGNPFQIGKHGTRQDVVAKYRGWLWQQIRQQGAVYQELRGLAEAARCRDLYLICWCKQPDQAIACHGDILQSAIHWLKATASTPNPHSGA